MIKNEIARLLGAYGGQATKKLYGKEHYKRMAAKSWENRPRRQAVDKLLDEASGSI